MISRTAGTTRLGSSRLGAVHALGGWRAGLIAAIACTALLAVSHTGPARPSIGSPSAPATPGLSLLPLAARGAISRALGADDRVFAAQASSPGVLRLRNPAQDLRAVVGHGRVAIAGREGVRVALSAVAIARGYTNIALPGIASARSAGNQVRFAGADVRESIANGPLGLEQTFVLRSRPAGDAPLRITQTISGNAVAQVDANGDGVTFRSGTGVLRYAGLLVTDATGGRVAARLRVAGRRLTIVIDDRQALYPLRVDPEFEQSAELTAADGGANDNFGYAVAVSGSTIVAGAINHTVGSNADQGAVYVYTLPASGGWADATQTAELTASDGGPDDSLGLSVAVDGPTIVASAPNSPQGAVYEWTMPAGGWSGTAGSPLHETAELTASNHFAGDALGYSVAVSGSTIVAGAPSQNVGANSQEGAAYVWTMPDGGWSGTPGSPLEQTAELTASDGSAPGFVGYAVSVSGSTVVAGAPLENVGANGYQGAAYVWTRPASGGWVDATQTAKLIASDGAAGDTLGAGVAVSGATIAVGAPQHNAVYEWTMPAGGWSGTPGSPLLQTAELAASDGNGQIGTTVAASGSTIASGSETSTVGGAYGAGALYVWTEPDGGWSGTPGSPLQETADLTANDGNTSDALGGAVAVSGSTIVGGAIDHMVGANAAAGAAYAFHPVVSAATASLSLSPTLIAPDGSSTSTATFTVNDTSGQPVAGDAVRITASGGQGIGPITAGTTPGTYLATITSTTAAGAATISATDLTASPNVTATATLTQGTAAPGPGNPPTPIDTTGTGTTPSNAFAVSGKHRIKNGTIVLTLVLPGPGKLILLATHSDPPAVARESALLPAPGYHRLAWSTQRRTTVSRAGPMLATLRSNIAGSQMLRYARREGWGFHVRVWITFIPTGGVARSTVLTVRVLRARTGRGGR